MKKLLILLFAVVTCLACAFGISACQADNGAVQTPPDDTRKPSAVEVTEVSLSETSIELLVGENKTLTATVLPSNATDQTVTWTSYDESVVKVENGKVTALKEGTAIISATASAKIATCKVTVKENVIDVTEVSLSETSIKLLVGENKTLTATVSPSNATDKTVTWQSSDDSVASVEDGKVTALQAGTAVISAAAGGKTVFCVIIVNADIGATQLQYTYSDGVATVEVQSADLKGNIAIPSKVTYNDREYTVTSITAYAFEGCRGLTGITIPEGITSVGNYAFKDCSRLTEVIWNAENCTNAGTSAYPIFKDCASFTTLTIGENVKTISDYTFFNCNKLTSVTIPNGVTSIGNYAFYGCGGLTGIAIPDRVTSIGEWTFSGCSGLTGITIPDSVTSIGNYAFYGCGGLTCVTIPDSVTSIGNSAFESCSGLTSITLPFVGATKDGTSNTHFGYIFGSREHSYNEYVPQSLKTVVVGGSSIDYEAFWNCSGLTSVTILNSVTSIDGGAFEGCSFLTIYCEATEKPSGWNDYWNYPCPVVWNCKNNDKDENGYEYPVIDGVKYSLKGGIATLVRQLANTTIANIPEKVIYKGQEYSVTSIGDRAFYGCGDLTSVSIPDGVTSIGYEAFYCCSGLKSVTIGNSVTSIGDRAFLGCSGLTSITIPDSVTSIGYLAFGNCRGLTEINYGGTIAQWNGIDKLSDWNMNTGNYTIHCTDGDIKKS